MRMARDIDRDSAEIKRPWRTRSVGTRDHQGQEQAEPVTSGGWGARTVAAASPVPNDLRVCTATNRALRRLKSGENVKNATVITGFGAIDLPDRIHQIVMKLPSRVGWA